MKHLQGEPAQRVQLTSAYRDVDPRGAPVVWRSNAGSYAERLTQDYQRIVRDEHGLLITVPAWAYVLVCGVLQLDGGLRDGSGRNMPTKDVVVKRALHWCAGQECPATAALALLTLHEEEAQAIQEKRAPVRFASKMAEYLDTVCPNFPFPAEKTP